MKEIKLKKISNNIAEFANKMLSLDIKFFPYQLKIIEEINKPQKTHRRQHGKRKFKYKGIKPDCIIYDELK